MIKKILMMKISYKPKILLFVLFLIINNICVVAQNENYKKTGIASFYADKFEGRTTANGEIYYHAKKTAAHRTLPFGSIVKVTNLENNKFIVVRINDRGPFVDNRVIDLSKSAANDLDFIKKGLAKVKVELIASIDNIPDKQPDTGKSNKKGSYYKLDVQTIKPTGKGVQIGSFKEDENVFRLAGRLKTKYNVEVYIEVTEIKKQKLYRVILGDSQNDSYLDKLKKNLSKEYPDCFIVQYK